MTIEIVVQQERERLLFLKLAIQVAPHVIDLGFHAAVRLEEEIRVATEEIAQINVSQVWIRLRDQVEFATKHVLTVLEGQVRVLVHNGKYFASLDFMCLLEIVKQTCHVLWLAAEQSTAIGALKEQSNLLEISKHESDHLQC